jgi:hypothetical protein
MPFKNRFAVFNFEFLLGEIHVLFRIFINYKYPCPVPKT